MPAWQLCPTGSPPGLRCPSSTPRPVNPVPRPPLHKGTAFPTGPHVLPLELGLNWAFPLQALLALARSMCLFYLFFYGVFRQPCLMGGLFVHHKTG